MIVLDGTSLTLPEASVSGLRTDAVGGTESSTISLAESRSRGVAESRSRGVAESRSRGVAERRAPSAEAMTAPRARELAEQPAPPDLLPSRRGGRPSSGYRIRRRAGAASLDSERPGLVRSARSARVAQEIDHRIGWSRRHDNRRVQNDETVTEKVATFEETFDRLRSFSSPDVMQQFSASAQREIPGLGGSVSSTTSQIAILTGPETQSVVGNLSRLKYYGRP